MVLYSGTTCPFSQRCRFVLFEKGMDFEIRDVDLFNKPEDISVMNPYGQVPILVERDLILYESNIINEYIDERFPHPQLMPADPVMRARARLFLFNFERELFIYVHQLERRDQPIGFGSGVYHACGGRFAFGQQTRRQDYTDNCGSRPGINSERGDDCLLHAARSSSGSDLRRNFIHDA